MKVVLSPNPYRDKGLKAAQAADRILRENQVDTAMCLPFPLEKGSRMELPKHLTFCEMQAELSSADMLICFGGDGTILHAAKDANQHGVPILGVNMGSVGFMAELEQGELQLLSKLAARKFTVERRMMLDVKVIHDGKVIYEDLALNDAVITKGAIARIIDLSVYGDRKLISDFSGDGIIVCTPTGSTAYSMSAGGPIVEPTAENIIVTPICAHSLHARALVLDCNRVVAAKMGRLARKTAYLSVDGGKAVKLCAGDTVEIRKSQAQTRLVRLSSRSFYEVLNQKLGKG
ncbi:NAD(+)/NADH kinase [Lawsonibacter faecis]|mgnify:FL=1|uniref:NAD kinase n=1 Tax=Lawsonibacter faecis TaxID=2763052 RepID=A0A8J6JKC6_9FIRM|nr:MULTISPECIES: NAD(+)/NADH kinase [Oscillospiraceae]MTQ97334.1 NAD(+)/NADH kinase [Pseudoflavonifractor sp. BIOML-A16]MTR06364.1 NAD(+)/NADH kinase [Pseudoflavonifractor sp. BIOML-A15]MTR31639.1 NAD(+)/NADH kinase [Pseudoflavonifractor sp. BIOML-A14]MTR72325.1 NAD(+)/NADH kinase [Pseudoflavonifractor sp. BIOML-A18]MTS64211.1 NAD(+)/NADH kinase [Pseudoflavonifractor sp. BIOML-A5]MTS70727.1 NAD(+)/NADH kinase [Pseudoflavonifractor sp. BIOML-A8]MTS89427.1 NAD(+)/NADH kinase [Pseudoflavonifrac